MKFQLKKKGLVVLLLMSFVMLFAAANAFGNPYAKYAGTTIVANFPNNPYYNYATQIIPEFTKETGIKVEIDKIEYMKLRDKQLLECSKPKGDYDIISYVIMWKTEYVSKGLLSPLAPFFTNAALADPDYDAADLVPAYVQSIGTVGGKKGYLPGPTASVYGIPFGSETSMFAYRKDIFDKHGWKVPKTYDELLKLCKLVKEKEPGMGSITMRGQAGHQVQHTWFNHLTPYGGEVFDDKWEPVFHKGGSIQAIKTMIEMVKTGVPGIPTFAQGDMTNAFVLGNAAMYLDATSLPGVARDPNLSKVIGKVGYALHPRAVKHSTQTGGFGIAIPANSQKKEAAFLLLQWLTTKASDRKITKFGAMPNRLSTLNDPGMHKDYPEFAAVLENLKYANPDWRPLIPEWPEISMSHIGMALHEAILEKKTPEKAMADVIEPVKKIMERAGYYTWKK